MKITTAQGLLCVIIGVSTAVSTSMQATTPRVTPIGQVIKKNPTRLINITSADIISDARTPPKIRQMIKIIEQKTESTIENSHAGFVEAVDADIDIAEDSMKKLNFYKVERPTTDSGLSTWILLSGQTITTPSTTKSPKLQYKPEDVTITTSVISNSNSIIKPSFKKRPIAIKVQSSISTTPKATTAALISSSFHYSGNTTKPTQIKENLKGNKNQTSSTRLPYIKINSTNDIKKNITKLTNVKTSASSELITTTEIMPEFKEGDLELPTSANPKKTRRPANKKKKDKNRRKRPSLDNKSDGLIETKVPVKISQKEKPISTQIYNYLAREVMPTVGVGLVGLVVTAGLASYFLYPFSGLRRSYEVDRRDKDLYYYDSGISSDYDGGIAEEEAIAKVIAGMPVSTNNYVNNYHQKSSYSNNNNKHTQVDLRFHPNPSMKEYDKTEKYIYDIPHSSEMNANKPYSKNLITQNVETMYNNQQFVAADVPKTVEDEVTPAAVPEHGPRKMKIRKRRNVDNSIINNEINIDESPQKN